MNQLVPTFVLDLSLCMLAIAAFLCLYRIIVGPSSGDRAVALDALTVCIMAAISVYSIKTEMKEYLSSVLVIGILGFIGLVLMAKFISGGDIIDNDDV